ncbi:MAG: enoyl-CoA hydratase/isomerase family protein [Candidatus Heimdallarchaeota archaeon]|nr:enoyl-CoA hydratase/isomerase family protein [Candidatus Heimdallarchaeota archaeon]
MELIFDSPREDVATLRFNQPELLNALSKAVVKDLQAALDQIESSASLLRALVITGSGDRAFVAGADITEMVKMTPSEARSYLRRLQQLFNRIERLRVPVIAAINGYALGGGLELALACDIRIATEKSVVGLPEVSLGLIPSAGGTQRLTRIVGESMAKLMILTGERINATIAYERGIIAKVVKDDQLDAAVDSMLNSLLKLAPVAIGGAKIAIQAALNVPMTSGLEIELNEAVNCFGTKDLREGMTAFIEKRKAKFTGN